MKVVAVVPHWNRRDLLETLLDSLKEQTRPFDEVIVVDNGSTDGSPEFAAGKGATVLRFDRNMGFAAAVNRGVHQAGDVHIAILNNDVTLKPNWLETLLSALEGSGAWFACGKLLRASDPSVIDGTFDEISRGACALRCGAGQRDGPLWNREQHIRFASMTATLFRAGLFEKVGPLDESFGSYLEDVEFGIRCALLRHAGLYVPSAVAYHRGSSTLGEWNPDTVRLLSRNQVLLAAKHFRGQAIGPILAGQLLWGVLALRHKRGWSYLQGKLSGLRAVGSVVSQRNQSKELRAVIEASERKIFELQQQTGFDGYWRAYFWLLQR